VLGPADDAVFRWINSGWRSSAADEVFRFFSLALEVPVIVGALAAVIIAHLFIGGKWRRGAILALVAFPIANEICEIFKHGLATARPCIDMYGVHLLLDYNGEVFWLDSSGTSSAHPANMAAIATVMALETGKWGIPWVVVAFLTGISRIYTGVHYPSQVLLGWTVGVLSGVLVSKGWGAIRAYRRQRVESAAGPSPNRLGTD
jgi:undecaprenyl-diphosphatase